MNYNELLIEADSNNLITKEKPLQAYDGRIRGNKILIRNDMPTVQKACVLAEELGHYYTTTGDIIEQSDTMNRKQEYRARMVAYNKMVGLCGIIDAYNHNCRNKYEIAEYLGVTEAFFEEALTHYRNKYGTCVMVDNYTIYFEPLGVLELY